jgi:hypothetical protein
MNIYGSCEEWDKESQLLRLGLGTRSLFSVNSLFGDVSCCTLTQEAAKNSFLDRTEPGAE